MIAPYRFRSVILITLATLLLFSLGDAAGTTGGGENKSLNTTDVGSTSTCQIIGNPDLYGLGVRLGVYFQWVGSYLANNFIPDEISGQLDANAIFLLSLFIAMIKYTIDSTLDFRVIDALVLIELSFGYFFSVLSVFGYRTLLTEQHKKISTTGTYLRLFITTAISGYTSWFWFDGIYSLIQSQCPLTVFFFVHADVHGGIKYFWRVASILCTLYFGILSAVAVIVFAAWLWASSRTLMATAAYAKRKPGRETFKFWEHAIFRAFQPGLHKAPIDQPTSIKLFQVLRIFNLSYIIWAIVTVELTLNWNAVKGVTGSNGLGSVGQQLPATIGAFSLIRAMWLICEGQYEKRLKEVTLKEDRYRELDDGHPSYELERTSLGRGSSPGAVDAAFLERVQLNGGGIPPLSVSGETYIDSRVENGKHKRWRYSEHRHGNVEALVLFAKMSLQYDTCIAGGAEGQGAKS